MNELINDEGVSRTAQATLGLVKKTKKTLNYISKKYYKK